ncbi:MAG: polysaccharide biosynthesis C-terminal domain-containing protein [Bacteroidota bacterium]
MNPLKKLAGQTAIYGISSILGRLLNYLLVPLHTYVFSNPAQFGVVTEMYSYVAFLVVVLTYGMETAFFRYSETSDNKEKVYSTTLISLLTSSFLFISLAIFFSGNIANALRYPDNSEYVIWFAIIVAFDALSSIPFARLRAQNKPIKFAKIKMINIFVYIFFNFFFLLICPYLAKTETFAPFIHWFYRGSVGVGYIFIANLIASVVTLVLLSKEIFNIKYLFDKKLFKEMIKYAFPLLILGLAGCINEVLDRVLLKYLILPKNLSMYEIGIYGACYKISILMTLFVQAFKYAAEPFFFAQANEKNAKKVYADIMKYFVIVLSLIFLGVMLYMDIIKYFIYKNYHSGLFVVPILLLANLFLGMFYNLSIWYKITGKTKFGAYISIIGAFITIGLNVWWIPLFESMGYFGYVGSAWATFVCYFAMMVISYFVGQKHYPINYEISKILGYIGFAVILYVISTFNPISNLAIKLALNTILFFVFVLIILISEKKTDMIKKLNLFKIKR